MERTPVNSSTILSVGYDNDSQILEVEFNTGLYQYYDVPEYIFDEFINSGSLGSYLHSNIKGHYSYSQI